MVNKLSGFFPILITYFNKNRVKNTHAIIITEADLKEFFLLLIHFFFTGEKISKIDKQNIQDEIWCNSKQFSFHKETWSFSV